MSARDLRTFSLLAELDQEERAAIALELEVLEFDSGARLFSEGDEADSLLLVAKGVVRLRSARSGHTEEFRAGSALGPLSLVADHRREATAETASRTRVLVLRRSGYERLIEEAPRAACRLLEAMLRENAELVRDAFERLECASIDPPAARDYTPAAS